MTPRDPRRTAPARPSRAQDAAPSAAESGRTSPRRANSVYTTARKYGRAELVEDLRPTHSPRIRCAMRRTGAVAMRPQQRLPCNSNRYAMRTARASRAAPASHSQKRPRRKHACHRRVLAVYAPLPERAAHAAVVPSPTDDATHDVVTCAAHRSDGAGRTTRVSPARASVSGSESKAGHQDHEPLPAPRISACRRATVDVDDAIAVAPLRTGAGVRILFAR